MQQQRAELEQLMNERHKLLAIQEELQKLHHQLPGVSPLTHSRIGISNLCYSSRFLTKDRFISSAEIYKVSITPLFVTCMTYRAPVECYRAVYFPAIT